jgi:ferrochelatase
MSFHGMLQKYVIRASTRQCTSNGELQADGLGCSKLWQQSRWLDQWLQPYTDKTIEKLAKDGVKRIAVVTPGFSADCLETLEEIAQENAEIFKHNGGEQFAAIPCLNDSDPGMDLIRQLVLR